MKFRLWVSLAFSLDVLELRIVLLVLMSVCVFLKSFICLLLEDTFLIFSLLRRGLSTLSTIHSLSCTSFLARIFVLWGLDFA